MLGQQQRLSRDRLQIDRHADGDEKEAHQQPFEGLDLCLDLKAEARGREQHPHHEAAERHRETRLVHCPGCEKDRQQHHQGKGLAVVLTQQMLEREGHQVTPEAEDQGHHAEDNEDLPPEGDVRGQGADIREDRHDREQRHHGQVLHQEDGEGGCSVAGGEIAALVQQLHDQRRGRERQGQPHQERRLPRIVVQRDVARHQKAGDQDLHRAHPEDLASERPQPPRLHLQTDQEEQHDHAQLGEIAHVLDMRGHRWAGRVRPDHDARHQKPENRAQTQVLEERNGECRHGEQRDRRKDKAVELHVATLPNSKKATSKRVARAA